MSSERHPAGVTVDDTYAPPVAGMKKQRRIVTVDIPAPFALTSHKSRLYYGQTQMLRPMSDQDNISLPVPAETLTMHHTMH
jgi:hypothetical protein